MLPLLFKVGSIPISSYLFFYFLGAFLGFTVILGLAKRQQIDRLELVTFLLFCLLAGILGSRIYSVLYLEITRPHLVDTLTKILRRLMEGGIFFGGLLGAIIFSALYLPRFFKGREYQVLDAFVVGGALGHGIGRIGCFFAGCCYGRPTDLPWGVHFKFLAGKVHPVAHQAVHPTQLYEALLNFVNFLLLFRLWKQESEPGAVFSRYLVHYGIIRLIVEFFRQDGGRGYIFQGDRQWLSLSVPQAISLLMIIAGMVLLRHRKKVKKQAKGYPVETG